MGSHAFLQGIFPTQGSNLVSHIACAHSQMLGPPIPQATGVSLVSRLPDFQGSPPQPRAITLSRLGCALSTQWDYCSSRSRWASEASQVVGKFICLVHRF